jgi:hypothetical protein
MSERLLSESTRALQARLRSLGTGMLLGGLVVFAVVFATTQPANPADDLLSGRNTKRYEVQMELVGGKANLLAQDTKDALLGLFRGRNLAWTLLALGCAGAAGCHFVAYRLSYSTLEEDQVAPGR